MAKKPEESLCKSCKHGLVVIATGPTEDDCDSWQFCNALGTPIKFTAGKFTVECTKYCEE